MLTKDLIPIREVASPVFLSIEMLIPRDASANSAPKSLNEIIEQSLFLALIDDRIIIWLPGQNDEFAEMIDHQIGLRHLGIDPESMQILTGRKLPSILRSALRSGRAFCSWTGQNIEAIEAFVCSKLGFSEPVRWIDLRDLARAGGWPENLDVLLRDLLNVGLTQGSSTKVRHRPNDVQCNLEVAHHWTTRIRVGLDQLIGVADLYDRLRQYDEPELLEIHNEINRRGIGLDLALAHAVFRLAREYVERQFAYIADLTEGMMKVTDLLDDGYVMSWLRSCGYQYPDLNTETIEWSLNRMRSAGSQHPPVVEAVLRTRLSLARQPIGSLMRAIELVNDGGRVCHHTKYFANRSGEFSSRGVDFGALIAAGRSDRRHCQLMTKGFPSLDELASNLPPDESIDRVLAVMVADCFVPAAHHVFQVVSWPCLKDEILYWLVGKRPQKLSYGTNSPIARVRRELAQQLRCALSNGHDTNVGRCGISFSPEVIEVRLPSGRAIHHRIFTSVNADHPTIVGEELAPPRSPTSLLGNVLNENEVLDDIVSGIGRDVVATALLDCMDAGVNIVAHGSDFIVLEIAALSYEKTCKLLFEKMLPPKWAQGLPCDLRSNTSFRLGCGGNWSYAQQDTCGEQEPQNAA